MVFHSQVKGIKGASPLIKLKYIDLPKTFVIDWMHSVLLGVVKTILAMWFDSAYKGRNFYIGDKVCYICFCLYSVENKGRKLNKICSGNLYSFSPESIVELHSG